MCLFYTAHTISSCSLIVFDYDKVSKDDFLGSATIPLRRVNHEVDTFNLSLTDEYPVCSVCTQTHRHTHTHTHAHTHTPAKSSKHLSHRLITANTHVPETSFCSSSLVPATTAVCWYQVPCVKPCHHSRSTCAAGQCGAIQHRGRPCAGQHRLQS